MDFESLSSLFLSLALGLEAYRYIRTRMDKRLLKEVSG